MNQPPYQQPVPPYGGYPPPQPPAQPQKNPANRNLKLLIPFSALWISPVKTIARLRHERDLLWPLTLLALSGVPMILMLLSSKADSDTSLVETFGISLLAGPLFGIIAGYLSMWVIGAIGRGALDGVAKNEEIRNLLAWSAVPRIYSIPVYLILIIALGTGFLNDDSYWEEWQTYLYYFLFGTIILLEGWSLVIFTAGLSEIMEFSIGIALFNYLVVLLQLIIWPWIVVLMIRFITGDYY